MKTCPRCRRTHGGICGIPAGVTLGFGARVGSMGSSSQSASSIKGKPKQKPKSARFLKGMLVQARQHEKKIADMMKILPVELPEYDDLMNRLAKVEKLILQLNQQIIAREE